MSSPSEHATSSLWALRAPGTPAVGYGAALTGNDIGTLQDAVAVSLASSPEARALLDGMELRVRTLNSTIAQSNQRCIYSVRGPVLWSETMTARANSFGSDDVFVCSAAERSFDTVENRILVAALDAIGRAARALEGPVGSRLSQDEVRSIAEVATEALEWRRHPRLAALRGGRLTGRDAARLRGGHRMVRLAAVLAVRDRAIEPFDGDTLVRLSDGPTRALHRFVHAVLEVLTAAELVLPELHLSDGALVSGGLTFRHPAQRTRATTGLTYRGVPLLPPPELLDRLPWRDRLPGRGVILNSVEDLQNLLARLAAREQERRAATSSAQASRSSTSSS